MFARIERSPSRRFTWLLSFFCLGILIGPLFLHIKSEPILFLLIALILAAIIISTSKQRDLLLFLLAFLFGIFRYQQTAFSEEVVTIADRVGQSVRLSGTITTEVEQRLATQRTLLSEMSVAEESVAGNMLVSFPLYPRLHYHDRVSFTCRPTLPEPIEGFRYDRFLRAQGVLATCDFPQFVSAEPQSASSLVAGILTRKETVLIRLRLLLPEPHAAFVSGLLFGGSSSLSSNIKEDFSRTGTSHLLAASGYNVSLFSVVLMSWLLSSPLGRRRGLIATIAVLMWYVIAAGMTPAVVRATIMASLLVLEKWVSRRAHLVNVLLLTLGVMLLVNPRLLLDDVGFQLSFVATAALLFVFPLYKHRVIFLPSAFGIRDAAVSSLIATVFTLPIVFWHFGQFSLVAPIVNVFVLPFIPLVMALTLIALLMSWIIMPAAQLMILSVWAISFVMLRVISAFSSIPFASVTLAWSHFFAMAVACAIGIWVYKNRHRFLHASNTSA